jgi:two-component system response regulator ResD
MLAATEMKPDEVRIVHGPLTLDKTRQRVLVAAHVIDFTKKEFALLWILASDPGRVFYRDELLWKVWGREATVDERTVDAHVARLRRKLRPVAKHGCRIETVWGVGYKLRDLTG